MHYPIVPTRYFDLLMEVAGIPGNQRGRIFAASGAAPQVMADPDYLLTRTQFFQIVRDTSRVCRDPLLGLKFGLAMDVRRMGILGYLVHACGSFAQATRLAIKYADLAGPSFRYQLVGSESEYAVVAHNIFALRGTNLRFSLEEWMGFNRRFLQTLSPRRDRFIKVELSMSRPPHSRRYRETMDCPVRFDEPYNRIFFSRETGDAPLETGDDLAREALEQQCQRLMGIMASGGHLSDRVRNTLLLTPGKITAIEEVAAKLGFHPRTLRRHLAAENTSFQKVLSGVMEQLAHEYLIQGNLTVEEVAKLLGYSETTNFRRAFVRWTGMSPSRYRETHQSGETDSGPWQ